MMFDVFDHMPQQDLHNGGMCYFPFSPIREVYVFCSQTHSSNIHTCTVNMN